MKIYLFPKRRGEKVGKKTVSFCFLKQLFQERDNFCGNYRKNSPKPLDMQFHFCYNNKAEFVQPKQYANMAQLVEHILGKDATLPELDR